MSIEQCCNVVTWVDIIFASGLGVCIVAYIWVALTHRPRPMFYSQDPNSEWSYASHIRSEIGGKRL